MNTLITSNFSCTFEEFEKEFICFCAKVLPMLIPKIFIENYKQVIKNNSKNSFKNIKAVMTSNGIYQDNFKFYIANFGACFSERSLLLLTFVVRNVLLPTYFALKK